MRAPAVLIFCFVAALAGCKSSTEKRVDLAVSQLQQAKSACEARLLKTSVESARCANEAEEAYLIPAFPYPDLARLRMATRMSAASRVDARQITQADADLEVAKVTSEMTSEMNRRFNQDRSARAQSDIASSMNRQSQPVTCMGGSLVMSCF